MTVSSVIRDANKFELFMRWDSWNTGKWFERVQLGV